MARSAVPAGYHAVTPYLIVDGASRAIAWYAQVFAAREVMRIQGADDKVAHAEIEVNDSRIMLADQVSAHDAKAPSAFGGSPVSLHLYVADVDATAAAAVAAGAIMKSEPSDKFYGDRMASLLDPFGHTWHIATHIEDVSAEETERRHAAMVATPDPGRSE